MSIGVRDVFDERYKQCDFCGEFYWRDDIIVDRYGNCLCSDCVNERRKQCAVCNEYVYPKEVREYELLIYDYIEDVYICDECEKDLKKMKCEKCGYEFFYSEKDYIRSEKVREIVRAGLCTVCFEEKQREMKMEIFDNEKQPSLPFETIDEVLMWLE